MFRRLEQVKRSSGIPTRPFSHDRISAVLLFFLFSLLLIPPPSAHAQPGEDENPLSFDRKIRPLLRRHCHRCHKGDEPSGDVDLAQDENPRLLKQHRRTWVSALQAIKADEMPPEEGPKLSDEDRKTLIAYLEKTLDEIDVAASLDPGTPTARRLSRHQYNLAVQQLTGLNLSPADSFSPDPISFGFAGIGSTMGISAVQVDQYASAAKRIVSAMVASRDQQPQVFERSFGKGDDSPRVNLKQSRQVLRRFASRAFRHRVDDLTLDRLMRVHDVSLKKNANRITALSDAMRAVLMSPRFFMRIENTQPDVSEAYRVDDIDLASRLSFFLWSAPPDNPLIKIALQGKLRDEEVLREQVTRMLRDDRVQKGLVKDFFGQWLGLSEIADHQVDAEAFPGFDNKLRRSMLREVELLIGEMIQGDLPLTTLIDADFIYLDRRLAKHYGLSVTKVDKRKKGGFVRTSLKDRRRGGVLTSAAVLMLQADPGRTNVPRRGNYVAATFLGDPPPPPPPGVPPLEEAMDDGKERPLREVLEEHRANPACAACHAKMDPLGFALQNYDAIGRWRDTEAGLPIDATGELPPSDPLGEHDSSGKRGDHFNGPVELKDLLLKRSDQFTRHLAEGMLAYALGRGVTFADEGVLRDAMSASQGKQERFSALVETIVMSFPFRYRSDSL